MSEKYKHCEQLEDLLRYMNDTMTSEERYKLERELERDPFLQEAFEGLSELKASEIDRNVRGMDVISGKKRLSLGFLKYVAFAAGIALMIVTGYWAFQNINFSKEQIVKNEQDTLDQKFREPYKHVTVVDTIDSLAVDSSKQFVADAGLNKPTIIQGQQANGSGNLSGQIVMIEKSSTLKETAKKKAALTNVIPQTLSNAEENNNKAEAISIQANQPNGVEEIVSESTTTDDSREDMEEPLNALKRPGVNAQPQPLGGNTLFRNYIDNNTKYPTGIKNLRKEYVKIRFKISRSGEPINFVIEKSPDDAFSQEAIRLIKSGPKWSPEIKDGIPVESEVTLKINFKPE